MRSPAPCLRWLAVSIAWLGVAAMAADRYKVGDEIEVLHLDEWRPGKVLRTNQRGDVLAAFAFGGSSLQRPFSSAEVRHAYESGAILRARVWTAADGTFREKAALIDFDNETIRVRKPDKTEIDLKIATLSPSDQKLLEKVRKESGGGSAKPPERPDMVDFGEVATIAIAAGAIESGRVPLDPDPLPTYLKMTQGGAGFPVEDFFDRLGAVLPVGGKDAWVLAAVENERPGREMPTRLLWASLARQKVERRQLLPPDERVLDYHSPSHRLLTFSNMAGDGADEAATLTLWEVLPTDAKAKPVVRWKADSGTRGTREPWGRIIDSSVVLQRFAKQDYVGWDVTAKQGRYRIAQQSFFAPMATLSPGRRYLFLPEDTGVRVFDAATGRQLAALPAEGAATGVAVSEDGRRVAVLGSMTLGIWDLTDPATPPELVQAETIGTPFARQLSWVGDERLLVSDGHRAEVLFSLKHRMSLWRYEYDMSAIPASPGHRVHEVVDRHLVYGATLRDGPQAGLAVGAVKLPGPRVDEMEASVDPESLLVMKPGTPVRLDVRTGEHDAMVRAALEARIMANGWLLEPTAAAVLVAEMKRGEPQTTTYRFGGFGRPESTQTATLQPFISTAKLMIGDQVAWQAGTSSGAPAMVILKEGQTVQEEIDRWQRPNPGFFAEVKLPAKIIDPANRDGLGTTNVTTRGLVVADIASSLPPASGSPSSSAPSSTPRQTLLEARRGFATTVVRSAEPSGAADQPTGPEFALIRYQSPVGPLAAYVTPDPGDGKRHPAIVWIAGGDNNSIGDVWSAQDRSNDQSASGFRQAGVVMMFPSQRGGNDNPGKREGFYGEVDDVLAATDHLTTLPYVDPDQIYLGGHSTGGTLAMLVGACSDRYRAVFALGPVSAAGLYGGEFVYCDPTNKEEMRLRSPIYWLDCVKSPMYVFEGERGNWEAAVEVMAKTNTNPRVQFFKIAGHDHFSVIAPLVEVLAAQVANRKVIVTEQALQGLR